MIEFCAAYWFWPLIVFVVALIAFAILGATMTSRILNDKHPKTSGFVSLFLVNIIMFTSFWTAVWCVICVIIQYFKKG